MPIHPLFVITIEKVRLQKICYKINKPLIPFGLLLLTIAIAANEILAQPISSIPPANGLSADRPVLLYERNGVLEQPWGAAGNSLPEQLFWNNVPANNNYHLQEMRDAANGIESSGRVPIVGCVAWGYEYTSATGGDTSNIASLPDMSNVGGWKQWGQWMKDPNRVKYYSTNWYGDSEPGYITPLMPMDPSDWPTEWLAPENWKSPKDWSSNVPSSTISYGQWLGTRLSQLALTIGARGMYCADYVVGLEWGDAVDYNQRVIDDFAKWAGIEIPQGSIAERADYIQKNYKSDWYDFKCVRFSEFYCSMGQNLLDNGKTPLIGGQTLGLTRGSGNDFRIYIQGVDGSMSLPGKYWFFNLELQSDDLRPPHLNWESGIRMGALACREPDMQLGAQLNAFGGQGAFDNSLRNANRDKIWGEKHITNQWLSVGWTHIAGRDGKVRRAPMSFMRSYWDAGKTPTEEYNLLLNHIPRHPFGPAVYYSVAIERHFEKGNGKYSNSWYMCIEKFLREISPIQIATHQGYLRGLCSGFWVSDAGVDNLKPADYPAAWIVYDSDYLPDDERKKLEKIAPVIDPEKKLSKAANQLFPLCPVFIEQDTTQCLNGLAFVDQNQSVILTISNSKEKAATGRLIFQHVTDGVFNCNGLLGSNDTILTVVNGVGSMPVTLPSRGNVVYEIPGLKWQKAATTRITDFADDGNCRPQIYPNPSTGSFFVKLDEEAGNSVVGVYNAMGVKVYEGIATGGFNYGINLSDKPKGVYFIKISNRKGHSIGKVVVK